MPQILPATEGIARAFIEQRADIDDPIDGYMIRRQKEGWLQGCVWWTNFTHWCRHFRWDSLSPAAGIRLVTSGKADRDGKLSRQLEQVERSGDPDNGGVVFSRVAEIGLIGALGCGGILLRMILDDLRQSGGHDFAVVQATPDSMGFYEHHGFVRVGAVARYSKWRTGSNPEVAYRHWLGTDEKLHSTDKPSIMMALPLHEEKEVPSKGVPSVSRARAVQADSFPLIRKTPVPPIPKDWSCVRPQDRGKSKECLKRAADERPVMETLLRQGSAGLKSQRVREKIKTLESEGVNEALDEDEPDVVEERIALERASRRRRGERTRELPENAPTSPCATGRREDHEVGDTDDDLIPPPIPV